MLWMPRKNPQHVQAVLSELQRSTIPYTQGWEAQPLAQLSHASIAERLNGARLF